MFDTNSESAFDMTYDSFDSLDPTDDFLGMHSWSVSSPPSSTRDIEKKILDDVIDMMDERGLLTPPEVSVAVIISLVVR